MQLNAGIAHINPNLNPSPNEETPLGNIDYNHYNRCTCDSHPGLPDGMNKLAKLLSMLRCFSLYLLFVSFVLFCFVLFCFVWQH